MADGGNQFADMAEAVARELLGEPNKQLSQATELRWGKRGSISLDLKKGTFYDHQESEGGGVLWLVERETGYTQQGGQAVEYLRNKGFDVEDSRPPRDYQSSGSSSGGGSGKKEYRTDKDGNWLPDRVPPHAELTKTYDYTDASGQLMYQVLRYDWTEDNAKGRGKSFVQRRPDTSKKGGWAYKTQGITRFPYRLPELLDDISQGRQVFIVEGEKKVDMLREIGVPATCNAGGAGKFEAELVQWFKGADAVILPDNDPQATKQNGDLKFHDNGDPVYPGKDHAALVARSIKDVAKRVRILEIPDLPLKGGVDDWLPAGGTNEKLYDLTDEIAVDFKDTPPEFQSFKSRFGAVGWADFDQPGPTYEHLIKGVLTEGEVSMLLGESQSGKSFLAIDIAMSVARGVPFFGRKVHKGGVIYQAGESAVGVRRRRFPAYATHHDCKSDPLDLVLLEKPVDLFNSDEDCESFIAECRHWNSVFDNDLKLIIIDTFNKATPGANENDGKDMGNVLKRCDRIRRETGAHVMLVHHLNAGGTKARGHTSLFGNVENVVTVRRKLDSSDSDGRQVREWIISKQKDGEDGIHQNFVLAGVYLGSDADGDRITSCVVQPPAGATIDQPEDDKGITASEPGKRVLRDMLHLFEESAVLAPAELKLPRGAIVINRKDLWEYSKATHLTSEDITPKDGEDEKQALDRATDTLRKQIKRGSDGLYNKGVIQKLDDWIWFTGKRVKGFGPLPTHREDPAYAPAPTEVDTSGDDMPFDMGDYR